MRNQNDGSDMIALDERQAQLDAFEAERQAYNMAMLDMQQAQEQEEEPAPVEPLEMSVGGDASLKALLAQNTETLSDELPEEAPINTDPVGTAQKMLASLTQTKKAAASPTAKSIKKSAGKGGASTGKEMEMAYEPLSAARDLVPQLKETGSARSQMEALARAYKLRAQAATQQSKGLMRDTMNAPTLDKPNLGRATLAAKRFNEGGEVEEMQGAARKDEAYQALEKYLQSRGEMPSIKISGYMPELTNGMYSSDNLNIGSGTVKIGKDTPKAARASVLAHEMTHAADRQMRQQAIEQGMFGKSNQYTEAYEKLVGPEGRNRASLARRLNPEWESENRSYRSSPRELAAYGVGAFSGPNLQDRGPRHVDATAATELQILLDLAQRNVDKGPKGLAKIPAFLRKMGRYSEGGEVEYRAKGSPEEGETAPPELTQEQIDAASKPSFRTSKSGIGRPEGDISRLLRSGEAYVNVAKGLTEMPYNLAGAPVDLATMVMRPFGYGTEKPVMGSDFIKEKMTKLGIRQAPPTDPTAKGFYTAGDLLSNLVNPASVPRKVGPAIEKGVKAGATEVGRQLDRAIMDNAGPLARAVPDAARPMYISRAPGGYFPTSRANEGGILSELDKAFDPVLKEAKSIEDPEKRQALATLFNQKAKDFYTKQAGSIQDPLRKDILSGALKFPDEAPMADLFPRLLQKGAAQGDLQALRLLEKNYDKMLDIRSVVPRREGSPVIQDVVQSQIMANIRDNLDKVPDAQLVAYSGRKPGAGPTAVADIATEIRQKVKDNPTLFSTVLEPQIARTIFANTRTSSELDMARYPGLYGTTSVEAMVRDPSVPAPANYNSLMPPNYFLPDLEMAIEKGQPIQDITSSSIKLLGMTPEKMLDQARQMSAEELNRMGFVDFLKKAYAGTQQINEFQAALPKVKKLIEAGKPPPADIMTYGVKDFLPTANDFRWVKVVKPDAVQAIAAGMNNSVASYATSKTYGSLGKGRTALDNGDAEVYALYDKNNVPHVTMEYLANKPGVPEAKRNTIAQLTGNGPLTANATPEKYAPQIVDLLNNIRPSSMPTSVKQLLEKTGDKAFLTEEVLAPLYFGVPIQSLRAADDNLLQQLNAPAAGLLRRLGSVFDRRNP